MPFKPEEFTKPKEADPNTDAADLLASIWRVGVEKNSAGEAIGPIKFKSEDLTKITSDIGSGKWSEQSQQAFKKMFDDVIKASANAHNRQEFLQNALNDINTQINDKMPEPRKNYMNMTVIEDPKTNDVSFVVFIEGPTLDPQKTADAALGKTTSDHVFNFGTLPGGQFPAEKK